MCDHHNHKETPRFGSSLDHGQAHEDDHQHWSRRDFMVGVGAAGAGTVILGGTPVTAFGQGSALDKLAALETDRVLVLIQLSGGNDGLNTVIPVDDDIYYQQRQNISISKTAAISIDTGVGLHPQFTAAAPLYGDGEMAIVHSVGYPSPNLSHFRSTDIWMSGSDSNEVLTTGWAGRYLDKDFPDFDLNPPSSPLAVQIGGNSTLMFQGPNAHMGMTMQSLALFNQLAATGTLYSLDGIPDTAFGTEMEYIRSVANDSFSYAEAVQTASEAGTNNVEYPTPNPLAANLAVVAQLISGNLGAKIYTVVLGGFDTHAGQANAHATLMRYLSEAVSSFYEDLEIGGCADRVLTMTYSEFGRRVNENGSMGTDHGTAAPLFVFGPAVNGGQYGTLPNLSSLDGNGNIQYQTDFRSIYATALEDWFGLSPQDTEDVFGRAYPKLAFVKDPTSTGTETGPSLDGFALKPNYPNPFGHTTTISYTLESSSQVELEVFDLNGKLVQRLVRRTQAAGSYAYPFDGGHLPSGTYFFRLRTEFGSESRKMTLVR